MSKSFYRSLIVFALLIPFIFISVFADNVSLSESDIRNNFSLSGFRYSYIVADGVGGLPTGSLTNFYGVNNGSVVSSQYSDIVLNNYTFQYSLPLNDNNLQSRPYLIINIPFYLYNVTSLDFDLYFSLGAFNGTSGTISTILTQSTSGWVLNSDVSIRTIDNKSFTCGYAYLRGINYFTIAGSPFTNNRVPFFKITVHIEVPRSAGYNLRYATLSFDELPSQWLPRDFQKFIGVLGISPDEPMIVVSDPQLGAVQSSLDDIQAEILENGDKLDDIVSSLDTLNSTIEEQTDRVLYEVSPENRVIINQGAVALAGVKDKTSEIVGENGLGLADSYMDESEVDNITDPSSILPENFDRDIGTVNNTLTDTFSNTPLEIMMIISLSLALISFILFGKKGSA